MMERLEIGAFGRCPRKMDDVIGLAYLRVSVTWQEYPGSTMQKSAIVKAVDHLSIDFIERYTLHELSEVEIQQAEEHIASCPECEDRVQDEIESPAAMRSSSVEEIRRMMETERKKPARRWIRGWDHTTERAAKEVSPGGNGEPDAEISTVVVVAATFCDLTARRIGWPVFLRGGVAWVIG
jgi:hypothetical protein